MLYHRKTPRAQWYDYTNAGMYFVTICCRDRVHYFGEIRNKQMFFHEIGKVCNQEIVKLSQRQTIDIHEWIVMPDHVHILLGIGAWSRKDVLLKRPNDGNNEIHQSPINEEMDIINATGMDGIVNGMSEEGLINRPYSNANQYPSRNYPGYKGPLLGSIIKLLKGNVTKYAQKNNIPFARQPRYHDHIVRNQNQYERIKRYIRKNPEKRSIK